MVGGGWQLMCGSHQRVKTNRRAARSQVSIDGGGSFTITFIYFHSYLNVEIFFYSCNIIMGIL